MAKDSAETLTPGAMLIDTGTKTVSPMLPGTTPMDEIIFGVPPKLELTVIRPEAVEFPLKVPMEL
jgi:hypothetical protein